MLPTSEARRWSLSTLYVIRFLLVRLFAAFVALNFVDDSPLYLYHFNCSGTCLDSGNHRFFIIIALMQGPGPESNGALGRSGLSVASFQFPLPRLQ